MSELTTNPAANLTEDFAERVYAGVLGKLIGVYLGRPFEGWSNKRIEEILGDITDYVHEQLKVPLIVTDDDITGTLTFIRAFEDYGDNFDIDARAIGQSWMNYLIEEKTILWWGGMGNSTEHTAFLRLKNGIEAPASGSEALNGKVVAEQIGAQIFIDGWAMMLPGEPHRAADLAEQAARVSHDGEAVYGARVIAAMEALAFVEDDVNKLIDVGLEVIPDDSIIARLIIDVRKWHAENPQDWRSCFKKIQELYGYDTYGGNCHMVPNHALIIMGLLYSNGDFLEAMKVVNTAGWDTDCNSGNLGCLMGIMVGLDKIPAHLRDPVADRCYVPAADGGRGISDAVSEAGYITNMARRARGLQPIERPAQFDFSMPGATQGFNASHAILANKDSKGLSIDLSETETDVWRAVFVEPEESKTFSKVGYALLASPRVNPGQTVFAKVSAVDDDLDVNILIRYYDKNDELVSANGEPVKIAAGTSAELSYTIPDLAGFPMAGVGIHLKGSTTSQAVLSHLGWKGTPNVALYRTDGGNMWQRALINGMSMLMPWGKHGDPITMVQNQGTGLMMYGTREWQDYQVAADVYVHLARRAGIAIRNQGMKRYYALLVNSIENKLQLIRELDGTTVLAETDFDFNLYETNDMQLRMSGDQLQGRIGDIVLTATDSNLTCGGIAIVLEEGRIATREVRVTPV